MSLALLLLGSGLLFMIIGGVLLVIKEWRKIAVACLALGVVLIVVPPVLVVVTSM